MDFNTNSSTANSSNPIGSTEEDKRFQGVTNQSYRARGGPSFQDMDV